MIIKILIILAYDQETQYWAVILYQPNLIHNIVEIKYGKILSEHHLLLSNYCLRILNSIVIKNRLDTFRNQSKTWHDLKRKTDNIWAYGNYFVKAVTVVLLFF